MKICLVLFVGLVVAALLIPKGSNRQADAPAEQRPRLAPSGSPILPAVTVFLHEHPEFGSPRGVEETAVWAEGDRQIVDFGSGKFLEFYEMKGKIITVWETGRGRSRTRIWGQAYEPPTFASKEKFVSDDLPMYTIVGVVQMRRGGSPIGPKFGEVLIPSISRQTPAPERERIARDIASAEGFDSVTIYSTEDARKANSSASFSKSHPRALKEGFLGSLRDGKFTAGEDVFP